MIPGRKRTLSNILKFPVVLASLAFFLSACALRDSEPAALWTDTPEMLIAVEMFNAANPRNHITVHYVDNLADALDSESSNDESMPSLVIGKGLTARKLSARFVTLGTFARTLNPGKGGFYPSLLKKGIIDGRQILLPVSFNTMLIIQAREDIGQAEESSKIAIDMDTIEIAAKEFKPLSPGEEKMAFSPRWPDRDFLFQWMQANGADFGEKGSALLGWNPEGLDKALARLRRYSDEVNGSAGAEDAFEFKYLLAPPHKNARSGKILYAAMDSSAYFLVPSMERSRLTFRYYAESDRILAKEDLRYAGIPKNALDRAAAERFLRWFMSVDTQQAILERSRTLRISESAFGIGAGFSGIVEVTESVFPRYYPELKGRAPPPGMITGAESLPLKWEKIKAEMLMPWLLGAAGRAFETTPSGDLTIKLKAYLDKNPDLR